MDQHVGAQRTAGAERGRCRSAAVAGPDRHLPRSGRRAARRRAARTARAAAARAVPAARAGTEGGLSGAGPPAGGGAAAAVGRPVPRQGRRHRRERGVAVPGPARRGGRIRPGAATWPAGGGAGPQHRDRADQRVADQVRPGDPWHRGGRAAGADPGAGRDRGPAVGHPAGAATGRDPPGRGHPGADPPGGCGGSGPRGGGRHRLRFRRFRGGPTVRGAVGRRRLPLLPRRPAAVLDVRAAGRSRRARAGRRGGVAGPAAGAGFAAGGSAAGHLPAGRPGGG